MFKKIANKGFNEVGNATSVSRNRHGLSKVLVRCKKLANRAAKRKENRQVFKDFI